MFIKLTRNLQQRTKHPLMQNVFAAKKLAARNLSNNLTDLLYVIQYNEKAIHARRGAFRSYNSSIQILG